MDSRCRSAMSHVCSLLARFVFSPCSPGLVGSTYVLVLRTVLLPVRAYFLFVVPNKNLEAFAIHCVHIAARILSLWTLL